MAISSRLFRDSFQTPQLLQNLQKPEGTLPAPVRANRVLVVSDFDHTLTRNDCGEQVAKLQGLDGPAFFAAAKAIGKRSPEVQPGGEFAAMALTHPKFAGLSRQTLDRAAGHVVLKDNLQTLVQELRAGQLGFDTAFFVVSAGPQETVRKALAQVQLPAGQVVGSRFVFDAQTDVVQGLLHVSAGAGKVEMIADLQRLLGVDGTRLIYFGDGSSDIAAMRYVQEQGGYNVAVEDNEKLRPYRSELFRSQDASDFLLPIRHRLQALRGTPIDNRQR